MDKIYSTLARILLALPLLAFGAGHFMNGPAMAGMVPAWLPGGVLWVYLTGAGLILAAVAINIRKADKIAALLLALLLVSFAVTVHFPNLQSADQNLKMMGMMGFFKDLGLAGGALAVAALPKS
jgi:uncharacterized membrane protein